MAASHTILGIMVGLLSISAITTGSPDTTLISSACNNDQYGASDPYAEGVVLLLDELINVTPNDGHYDYYTAATSYVPVAYGHATCNTAIGQADCGACLEYARGQIKSQCRWSIGAQMTVQDCKMRYEQYQFSE